MNDTIADFLSRYENVGKSIIFLGEPITNRTPEEVLGIVGYLMSKREEEQKQYTKQIELLKLFRR